MRRLLYGFAAILLATLLVPSVAEWLNEQGRRWFKILAFSWALSYLAIPLVKRFAVAVGAVDIPKGRKSHEAATPLLGGLAIFASFIGSFTYNFVIDQRILLFLCAAGLLMFVSFWDDMYELSAKFRLFIQVLCTGLVIYSGVYIKILPYTSVPEGSSLYYMYQMGNFAITSLWIIGLTNAMNFFDGMDGLAAGISVVIALLAGLVAFQNGQPLMGWISVGIVGSCLGFLPYNFKPRQHAEIFLGDCGSTFLGFLLAYIGIEGNWSDDKPWVALGSPLLIFGILIYDMIHITVSRVARGEVKTIKQWVNYVGHDHIHHRFYRLLGSKKKAVLFILLLNLCLGANALLLLNTTNVQSLLLVTQFLGFIIIVTILEHSGNRRGIVPAPHQGENT